MTTSAYKWLSVAEYRAADSKSAFCDPDMCAMSGGSEDHSLIAANVGVECRSAVKGRPCRIDARDMPVKAPMGPYTDPDVGVVCGEPQYVGGAWDILLNPNVMIEACSPSTEAYDGGTKCEHNRTIPSIEVYMPIAQDHPSVEHYVRRSDGCWLLTAAEGEMESAPSECGIAIEATSTNSRSSP